MPERAFVTGLTGMVGSHLADYILERTDWRIYGLARWRSPFDNIAHLLPLANDSGADGGGRLRILYGDLRDYASLDRAIEIARPDYVFHLAAQSYPKTSFDSPADTLDTNVLGTARLLEALRRRGDGAVVHICASSEVFGKVPRERGSIDEECPFHPASPYAISKVGADLLGRFYAEAYGMTVMTTRAFTHTGPRRSDVFVESSFAKQIAMIEAGQIPPVVKVGNLESIRTFADVRDMARAYHMLATIDPAPGAFYNIGGDRTCSVGDMLQTLLSMSRVQDIRVEVDPARLRPLDADRQVPATGKFRAATGWRPEIPFEDTMRDLLQYWRDKVRSGGRFLAR